MGLASITIAGNLGGDPEMRYQPNGDAMTSFNVAVSHSKKNNQTNEWVENTNWYRCTIWGKRAERVAEQLRKGNKVSVAGNLEVRDYTDRNGVQRYSLDLRVNEYQLQEKRERTEGYGSEYDSQESRPEPRDVGSDVRPVAAGNADIDDLPF